MGNESIRSSRKSTKSNKEETNSQLYPTHKSVEEMLNRGTPGPLSPDGSINLIENKAKEDPHQQALLVSHFNALSND